jgi:hypothetical protein
MPIKLVRTEDEFRAGIEDAVILPLVVTALAAKGLARAALSVLLRILDYSFPLVMQLVRLPLFAARVLGDGVVAALQVLVACLPVAEKSRQNWHEFIGRKWSWLRQSISYQAFEQAVHRAFERGMGWVFKKCRYLTPSEALYVIMGAVLWLPVSLGVATAIHAFLLANASSLPAWMQLLHPLATIIAKSKLLVLPVYPAAWPQAKKHPFIQAIAGGYRNFKNLSLIQRTGCRYRQTELAMAGTAAAMERVAALVGLSYLSDTLWSGLNGLAARIGGAFRAATRHAFESLSGVWLIGPVVKNCAAYCESVRQRNAEEKASEKLRGFFARWSIKFSAEYYEAKERAIAAKAAYEKMPESR